MRPFSLGPLRRLVPVVMSKSTSAAPGPKPASPARNRSAKVDAGLAFLLARQTLLQVELLINRSRATGVGGAPRLQSELGAAQLSSVAMRLTGLSRSRELHRGFDAEEILIRVRAMVKALWQVEPSSRNAEAARPLTAIQVKDMLTARLRIRP